MCFLKRSLKHFLITLLTATSFFCSFANAQSNGQFNVTVDFETHQQEIVKSVTCKSEAPTVSHSVFSVVCSSGTLLDLYTVLDLHSSNTNEYASYYYQDINRYVAGENLNGPYFASINNAIGISSETSWRLINFNDRHYFEMLINW